KEAEQQDPCQRPRSMPDPSVADSTTRAVHTWFFKQQPVAIESCNHHQTVVDSSDQVPVVEAPACPPAASECPMTRESFAMSTVSTVESEKSSTKTSGNIVRGASKRGDWRPFTPVRENIEKWAAIGSSSSQGSRQHSDAGPVLQQQHHRLRNPWRHSGLIFACCTPSVFALWLKPERWDAGITTTARSVTTLPIALERWSTASFSVVHKPGQCHSVMEEAAALPCIMRGLEN
ncbi:hypothetical protein FOZ63_026578, partial [Perkinsus olseni]